MVPWTKRLKIHSYCVPRPDELSLTAARARAGEARLISEIIDVCDVIFCHGTKSGDGRSAIQFGQLFQVILILGISKYLQISDLMPQSGGIRSLL